MLSYVPTALPHHPPASTEDDVGHGTKNPSSSIKMEPKKPSASLAFKVKSILTDLSEQTGSHKKSWKPAGDGDEAASKPRRKPRPRKFMAGAASSKVAAVEEEEPSYLRNSMSGKDRLLAIIAAEKAEVEKTLKASTTVVATTAAVVTTESPSSAYEDGASCASTETTNSGGGKNGSFLRRGVASLRRSFRKATKKTSFMKRNAADLSHDSGLGEDSDTSHRTTPLTPINSSASPTTPNPILRTTRSFSNSSSGGKDPVHHHSLKHVMIREPSLRHLPSALRNSFPGAQPSKPQLVRLETAQHRHYRHSYHADSLVGDVSSQWNNLYFRAAQEVKLCLPDGCDPHKSLICDLIFSGKSSLTRDRLMVMEAEEVDETINLLYKILYHDWMARHPPSSHLSIILHCVQKFLIIVVDVCPELEANDRRRLAICTRGLLRQCEDARYSPIGECLSRTRTLYIQVWCAILCVPFSLE